MATKKTASSKSDNATTVAQKSGGKTSAGSSSGGGSAGKGGANFPKSYIKLRTVLDGLEITALRYCLKDKNSAARARRAEEIVQMLMPIVEELEKRTRSTGMPGNGGPVECPDGFTECNGCCVPYSCP